MKVLLFGGTTEGRVLAQWLDEQGHTVTVCVATEYGATLLPKGVGIVPHIGRLDEIGMELLIESHSFALAVDATHPYAAQVSKNLRAACLHAGLPYYRLIREGDCEGDWHTANSINQAAERLETLPGNVLLTTGSKELEPFAVSNLRERCFPRVLPSMESLNICLNLGFSPAHILCMQGPFSKELNVALIRQYQIRTLVTKASGSAGGFMEKLEAAQETGCQVIVIARPVEETGYSLDELKRELEGKIQ